ncbi:MAG TPA: EAL domain-containing protein [Arthrobacter sp.]|nr:EAL domain-containing protein [Arthrobacter sp.]
MRTTVSRSTTRKEGAPRSRDLLVGVLAIQVVFTLISAAAVIMDPAGFLHDPEARVLAGSLVLMPIAVAGLLASRFLRSHRSERMRARATTQLMDTVLSTSREWLWALDEQGNFTFSSPASASLFGYSPSELVGNHCGMVIDVDDVEKTLAAVAATSDPDGPPGALVCCRHRDGSQVWLESSAHARSAGDGQPGGLEGTSRPVPPETAQEAAAARSRVRISDMIDRSMLLTAFQPIRRLVTGKIVGVEALTRFVSDEGANSEYWFSEASAVGLAAELEIAALETALVAAQELPPGIYVALNISPATCLDPRLPGILESSCVPLARIILELTERLEVSEYGPLISALAPLRQLGLRVAVDDAGSGFSSMRHVLHIRPDIIKLDRSLISGIDDDLGQRALGAALAEFARQIGATLVAEGIETQAELTAVTALGLSAGQGYFFGRPSINPREWAAWHDGQDPTEPMSDTGAQPVTDTGSRAG